VPNDDALVRVRTTAWKDQELDHREVSLPELEDLGRRTDLFAAVAGWARGTVGLTEEDGERGATVSALFVTPNYFSTLRLAPSLGRLSAGRNPHGPPELTVVLSHKVWRDQFGGDPNIIGEHVKVNGVIVEVVGVGPERFGNAVLGDGATIFLPISARAQILGSVVSLGSRDVLLFNLFAKLAPGVDVDRADAQVRQLSAAAVAAITPPVPLEKPNAEVLPLRGNTEELDDDVIVFVLLIALSAVFVLLVSCTNVSALLIGAAVARRQEIAVRLSMGASRMRLVRQLVTETSMLALAGATLGIGLYWLLTHAIRNSVTAVELAPDWVTVIYTALFAIATGIVFGLSPALHATRLALSEVLKGAATSVTSRSRMQQGFIVAQIALTQPLLVMIAFVLLESADEVKQTRTSSTAARAIRLQFDTRRIDSTSRFAVGVAALRARLATMPGVTAVLPEPTGALPVYPTVHPQDRTANTDDTARELTTLQGTVPGYLAALGARIVRGRDVQWADTAMRPRPLLISEEMARRYLGSADPIGRRITFVDRTGTEQRDGVVVGVYEAHASLIGGTRTQIYRASAGSLMSTLIIAAGDGAQIVPAVRSLVMRELPSLPIGQLATIAQANERVRRDMYQVAGGAGVGAALALLLASIGLYGAIALAVGQRTREIAIRMAIGARAREVIAIFFARGVRLAVVGLAIGLPLSLLAIWSLLEQANEKPLNVNLWLISAAIASVVLAVASLATWLPARRAALVDPMKSLRTD
jgi:predicted permease